MIKLPSSALTQAVLDIKVCKTLVLTTRRLFFPLPAFAQWSPGINLKGGRRRWALGVHSGCRDKPHIPMHTHTEGHTHIPIHRHTHMHTPRPVYTHARACTHNLHMCMKHTHGHTFICTHTSTSSYTNGHSHKCAHT